MKEKQLVDPPIHSLTPDSCTKADHKEDHDTIQKRRLGNSAEMQVQNFKVVLKIYFCT